MLQILKEVKVLGIIPKALAEGNIIGKTNGEELIATSM